MSQKEFEAYQERLMAQHGAKFDASALSTAFGQHFGRKIRVRFPCGTEKNGYVSGTTGWRPSLMLMLRVNSRGSSWLLDSRCEVLRLFSERRS